MFQKKWEESELKQLIDKLRWNKISNLNKCVFITDNIKKHCYVFFNNWGSIEKNTIIRIKEEVY